MVTQTKDERLRALEQCLGKPFAPDVRHRIMASMPETAVSVKRRKPRDTAEALARLKTTMETNALTEEEAAAKDAEFDKAKQEQYELYMNPSERFERDLLALVRSHEAEGITVQMAEAARFVAEAVCRLKGITTTDRDIQAVRDAMHFNTPRAVRIAASGLIRKPPPDMNDPVGMLVWRARNISKEGAA